jgi:hypothetical protein
MNHPLDSVRRAMMEFREKARDWIEKGWAGCRFVSQRKDRSTRIVNWIEKHPKIRKV